MNMDSGRWSADGSKAYLFLNWHMWRLVAVCMLLSACADPFQMHPWEVEVDEDRHGMNNRAVQRIQERLPNDSMPFTFAVIGDPQSYYDDLDDALAAAEDAGASFAVVMGDLTDQGLLQEFNWCADILERYETPSVAIIGNHDHVGNGRSIYELMFGPRDMTFIAGGVRFVLFDNVVWENEVPVDHAWLNATLAIPHDRPTLVFMHIHPTDVQVEGEPAATMDALMEQHTPAAGFMGHLHGYATGSFTGGTPWATSPWPRAREYLLVTVANDTVTHELTTIP